MAFDFLESNVRNLMESHLFGVEPSSNSKATMTFFISFWIACHQKSVPVSLSIVNASWTECGNLTPYLWFVFHYLLFTFARMIRFLLRRVSDTHHLKAGSSWIRLATAYSASWIGFESLTCLRSIQSDEPSCHWQSSFHPFVVVFGFRRPFLVVVYPFGISTAVRSFL
jgi:hypothetical protein